MQFSLFPGVKKNLNQQIGARSLFGTGPWTVGNALSWSKQSMSMHMRSDEIIAVTIDQQPPTGLQEQAEAYGYMLKEEDNHFILIKGERDVTATRNSSLRVNQVHPWRKGGHTEWNKEKATISPIFITKNHLTIPLKQKDKNNTNERALFSEETRIAHLSSNQMPGNGPGQELTAIIPLQIAFQASQLDTTLAKDELGLAVGITMPSDEWTIESLTSLGSQMINLKSLSTVAWTFEDGTEVSEIVANTEEITPHIQTEEEVTLIIFQSGIEQIHLIKTPENVTISNRNIERTFAERSVSTSCLNNAQSFIRPQLVFDFAPELRAGTGWYMHVHEIATSQKKQRFCW